MSVVLISGSPTARSRSAALLSEAARQLERNHIPTHTIAVRELPAEDLLHARHESAAIVAAADLIEKSWGVIIATPIYKASHAGVLKAFLDLLRQNALAGKPVFPIAVADNAEHLLAVDYSLKPVLSALGATHIQTTLSAMDRQVTLRPIDGADIATDTALRLHDGVRRFIDGISSASGDARRPAQRRRASRLAAA